MNDTKFESRVTVQYSNSTVYVDCLSGQAGFASTARFLNCYSDSFSGVILWSGLQMCMIESQRGFKTIAILVVGEFEQSN